MNSEDIAIELFNLLDNIDTLSDVCGNDGQLFKILAMREVKKRFDFATADGAKVVLKSGSKCGNKAIDEPAADCTYKPTYVYSYIDGKGNLVIVREVPTEQ